MGIRGVPAGPAQPLPIGEVSKDEAGDEGGEGGVVADGADRRLCVKQPGEASPLPKAELVWKRELGRQRADARNHLGCTSISSPSSERGAFGSKRLRMPLLSASSRSDCAVTLALVEIASIALPAYLPAYHEESATRASAASAEFAVACCPSRDISRTPQPKERAHGSPYKTTTTFAPGR